MTILTKRILGTIAWFPFHVVLYAIVWKNLVYEPLTTWLFQVIDLGSQPKTAALVSLIQVLAASPVFFPYYWLWFIYGQETPADSGKVTTSANSPSSSQTGAEGVTATFEANKCSKTVAHRRPTAPRAAYPGVHDKIGAAENERVNDGSTSKNNVASSRGIDNKKSSQTINSDSEKTLYDILGIRERARLGEILEAHRRLVQRWHSDKHFGYRRATENKLKWFNRAYEVLTNQRKRELYDRQLLKRRNNSD